MWIIAYLLLMHPSLYALLSLGIVAQAHSEFVDFVVLGVEMDSVDLLLLSVVKESLPLGYNQPFLESGLPLMVC